MELINIIVKLDMASDQLNKFNTNIMSQREEVNNKYINRYIYIYQIVEFIKKNIEVNEFLKLYSKQKLQVEKVKKDRKTEEKR